VKNINKENCIILGGTGFIGSNLTSRLILEGYPVTVFANTSSNSCSNLDDCISKITFIEGDISNTKLLSKIITKDSYIFDLATSSVPSSSTDQVLDEIRSHVKLIEICCEKKVKKIIFTSSGGGIYGNAKKMPISELHHLQPSSPHAIGKATIEYFLSYTCNQFKIPFIIYRISNPYGQKQIPKTGFGLIPTLFTNIILKTPPILYDDGKAIRDFIYIDDLIEAIKISFAKKSKYTVYNIGYGDGVKIIDIWSKIKKITKSEIEPLFLPKRAFDVKKYILNNKRFCREFKWKPKIKLSVGLQNTWNWIRDKY